MANISAILLDLDGTVYRGTDAISDHNVDAVIKQLGKTADECVIVGDNLLTGILAGYKSGMRSILILTGVATRKEAEESKVRPNVIDIRRFESLNPGTGNT
ncbi:MAG: hypothetical protein DRQ59_15390 [Gammaproteobacteria bacterium]|nr:MAG: hypothetical protein DRQ59_15390 [Gammaproteobacteria bacterium]